MGLKEPTEVCVKRFIIQVYAWIQAIDRETNVDAILLPHILLRAVTILAHVPLAFSGLSKLFCCTESRNFGPENKS